VLESATGASNKAVADRLGVEAHTVSRWRARFVRDRLEGLTDEPRPGGPRKITDGQVEEVVVKTLETTPKDATHWSTRSMAKEVGLSQSAIARTWRTFGLKPHLVDTFKLSKDPQFIERVRDVVGLYLAPPEHALVLCVDEKAQIQALDRSAPVLPMTPGMPERRTHDYVRGGVTTLFAALNTATGEVIGQIHRRHRAVEFKKFLIRIDQEVPVGLGRPPDLRQRLHAQDPRHSAWLAAHPRFHVHFTSTSSSWLNQVERWFGLLTDKQIRRGVHKNVQALEKDIRAWIKTWNEDPKPFVWTKTADEILERLAGYVNRIPDSGH
jgi:transposase